MLKPIKFTFQSITPNDELFSLIRCTVHPSSITISLLNINPHKKLYVFTTSVSPFFG